MRMLRSSSITFAFCAAFGVLQARHAAAATIVYVTAEEGGEVVAVDPDVGEVIERVKVGKRPRGVKVSRDRKHLLVALSGSPRGGPGVDEAKLPPADRAADGIGVVELGTHKVSRTIESGRDPEAFDISRDGKTLFVANEETAEMSVVDLVKGKVNGRVGVGGEPEGVAVRPDGKMVLVTSEVGNEVFAIALPGLVVSGHVATGARPRGIAYSQDGTKAFVTCELGGEVTVIDTHALTAIGHIKIEGHAKTPLPPRPMGIALAPDGKHLYVSHGRGGSISEIEVASSTISRFLDGVGDRPWGIAVSADGSHLFTANGPSQDVSVVDIKKWEVVRKIQVGGLPWGLAVVKAKGPASKPRRFEPPRGVE